MTELKDLLSASLLIGMLYFPTTTATGSTSSVTRSGQQTMSRQATNTDNLPIRATAPFRIPTLAATKHSAPAAVLSAQDRGNSVQLPVAHISDRTQQPVAASDSTEPSESEQLLLQHLGWSLAGRRGLDTVIASPVRTSPSKSSGAAVLKHFWKHLTGLSWLPRSQNRPISPEKPLVQHDEGLTAGQHAQHAKQEAFKLAQQVLHRAATDTLYLRSKRHLHVVTPKTAGSSQQHERSADPMVTKRTASDKLTDVESNPDASPRDIRIPVPPQHAQGAQGQDNTAGMISKGNMEQSAQQPLSENRDDHTGDFIEWPSDDDLDDDLATARASVLVKREEASTALAGSSTGLSQHQSLQVAQDQLPKPAKYGVQINAQPQVDLAHAKQAFAQYLTGVHGHPEIHE